MKKKCVIFGAGGTGRKVYTQVKDTYDVECFVDNDESKWGTNILGEGYLKINNPKDLTAMDYDTIFIGSLMGLNDILRQLLDMEIDISKIDYEYVQVSVKSREFFLRNFRNIVDMKGLLGAVAEAGVYQGEFAKIINEVFPERKCYLFDTFEGFDARDFDYEKMDSLTEAQHLKKTSVDLVLEKMKTPGNCIIKKGYFPETAAGLEEQFCFVNLDMDLYKPILDGLEYFYPRVVEGGVILVHDYFSNVYPNVKASVADFETRIGKSLKIVPVGDDISLAIIK